MAPWELTYLVDCDIMGLDLILVIIIVINLFSANHITVNTKASMRIESMQQTTNDND